MTNAPARLRALTLLLLLLSPCAAAHEVCIVGGGVGGSSLAYFLAHYSGGALADILVLERRAAVGGRMATVTVAGDTFEAGGTVLHPRNLHAAAFASLLGLRRAAPRGSSRLGMWDGARFVWRALPPPSDSGWAVWRRIRSLLDAVRLFKRYGLSLLRMDGFVKDMLGKFMRYYGNVEERPVFETVEEMLEWSGLYGLTQRRLEEELADRRLSPLLVSELVTVIMRINYGQDVSISGLAGAVSLAGSNDGLWSVAGGNWQLAAGLLKLSNASLHLEEEVTAISYNGGYYELISAKGSIYNCKVAVIAMPLDEQNVKFTPPISTPRRRMQHTYATFIRGLLNPAYFGLHSHSEVPELIGTLEIPTIPFSSIGVLKKYNEDDKVYKVFSRGPLGGDLLDAIFSIRKETVEIDWAAYPHYEAPEAFAPFLLDGKHLYYVNSFESAASTIETSAVAAENIARLILSRLGSVSAKESITKPGISHDHENLRAEL